MQGYRQAQSGTADYLFYGGAKAAGKSYFVRAKQMLRRLLYPGTVGIIIRRTYPELRSNHIQKMLVEYPFLDKWYKRGERLIQFPNGSVTEFKFIARTDDVYKLQGIEADDIDLDEATQHEEEVFKIVKNCLRMDPRIARKYPGFHPQFTLTGNPGGIGHEWVKRLFVDRDFNYEENPDDYVFIQATIKDNPLFLKYNPKYLQNLKDMPEFLRRAYLEGDWEIFVGQYFKKLRKDLHLIRPFELPKEWNRFRTIDWGYGHDCVVLWWCVDPMGNAYIYRYYKKNGVVAEKVARTIREMTPGHEYINKTIAGHDMWMRERAHEAHAGQTIAGVFAAEGILLSKGVTDRPQGWQALMRLIEWEDIEIDDMGRYSFNEGFCPFTARSIRTQPRLKIFDHIPEVFKGLARLIHCDKNPEDVKKMNGDDIGDSAKLGAMDIYKTYVKPDPKSLSQQYREARLSGTYKQKGSGWKTSIKAS